MVILLIGAHVIAAELRPLANCVAVACGSSHSVALLGDGTVWTWGNNDNGQLGRSTPTGAARRVAGKVDGITDAVGIAAGSAHTLVLRADGTVMAFGYNITGELGIGNTVQQNAPVPIPTLSGIVAVAACGGNSLALDANGAVWGWGANGYGQVGITPGGHRTTPVKVPGLPSIQAIYCGTWHALALSNDGKVYSWGRNNFGQLGTGDYLDTTTPKLVALDNVVAIGGGALHSLASTDDGKVWSWGSNGEGQLGDGGTGIAKSSVPVETTLANSGVLELGGGADHTLVVRANGALWGAGGNAHRQLGKVGPSSSTPHLIGTGYLRAAGGNYYTLALTTGGSIHAWGNNSYGQLGNGTTTSSSATPVTVLYEHVPVPVLSVALSTSSLELQVGETVVLEAFIHPANATIKDVTWSSSEPDVVGVTQGGMVTALLPGEAVIRVTTVDGGLVAECVVRVNVPYVPVVGISLDRNELTLTVGQTWSLVTTVSPPGATELGVTWLSQNPDVAQVTPEGLVTGIAPGQAVVTATTVGGGLTASCRVVVEALRIPVTDVTVDTTEATLTVGDSITLTATVYPVNATERGVVWTVLGDSVVEVTQQGLVTALAPGEAVVRVTTLDGGLIAECVVRVNAPYVPVAGLSLDRNELTLTVGQTWGLVATVSPPDATEQGITLSSQDPDVAQVSPKGMVTAISPGEALVTATTLDGGLVASCRVVVAAPHVPVTYVALDITNATVIVGESITLTATVYPVDATERGVVWTSSDPTVVSVNSKGLVTGIALGEAIVFVTVSETDITAHCSIRVEQQYVPIEPTPPIHIPTEADPIMPIEPDPVIPTEAEQPIPRVIEAEIIQGAGSVSIELPNGAAALHIPASLSNGISLVVTISSVDADGDELNGYYVEVQVLDKTHNTPITNFAEPLILEISLPLHLSEQQLMKYEVRYKSKDEEEWKSVEPGSLTYVEGYGASGQIEKRLFRVELFHLTLFGVFTDVTPPDSPYIGYKTRFTRQEVFTVTGFSEGYANVTVTVGDKVFEGNADASGMFRVPVMLAPGVNQASVYATDRAGNKGGDTTIEVYLLEAYCLPW